MGRSTYNFDKRMKEKARQQKQLEKASKRMLAKEHKANEKTNTPNADSNISEPELEEEIADITA